MEMPFILRTLPPEALDVLRFFGSGGRDHAAIHADEIAEGAALTAKGLGKAIRRLVTKSFAAMTVDQVYRLTDSGKRLAADLIAYERTAPPRPAGSRPVETRYVRRRVLMAVPTPLVAGQPTTLYVGLDDAETEELIPEALDLLIRLTVINGEPRETRELPLRLANRHLQQSFEITPGYYGQVRVRVQVCQIENDNIDEEACGGLYVDLAVQAEGVAGGLATYGADVMLKDTSGIDISDFLSM